MLSRDDAVPKAIDRRAAVRSSSEADLRFCYKITRKYIFDPAAKKLQRRGHTISSMLLQQVAECSYSVPPHSISRL